MDTRIASPSTDLRDRIVEHIKSSGHNPGERIETERALQDILGVSRSRVRDALAALEAQGIVTRRIGGTYLAQNIEGGGANIALSGISSDNLSPAALIEARMVLEVGMVPLIVANATNNDLKALRAILDRADAAKSSVEFESCDAEFHHRLALSARNDLISKFAEMVIEARKGIEWGRAKRNSSTPPLRRIYQSEHRKIIAAIGKCNVDEASAAMRGHLASIRDRLVGNY